MDDKAQWNLLPPVRRPPDRGDVVAAPVEIELSVIIEKQVRIPEIEGSRNALKRPVQDIFCAVNTIASTLPSSAT